MRHLPDDDRISDSSVRCRLTAAVPVVQHRGMKATEAERSAAALLGRKGGVARMKTLTGAEQKALAMLAAETRWANAAKPKVKTGIKERSVGDGVEPPPPPRSRMSAQGERCDGLSPIERMFHEGALCHDRVMLRGEPRRTVDYAAW
jgi:hypothetical protein